VTNTRIGSPTRCISHPRKAGPSWAGWGHDQHVPPPKLTDARTPFADDLPWFAAAGRVDLGGTAVRSVAGIERDIRVVELFLYNTAIRDLTPLAALSGLRVLRLDNTPVDDLTPLAGLAGLRDLSLAGTRVTDLSALYDLPELAEVDLENTRIDADQVAALRDARPGVPGARPILNAGHDQGRAAHRRAG